MGNLHQKVAEEFASSVRLKFGFYELRERFIGRQYDELFSEIGHIALPGSRRNWPEDIYVWEGFEILTNSPRRKWHPSRGA